MDKTPEKLATVPFNTSTTPSKETRNGSCVRACLLDITKDFAASVEAGPSAGSRTRVLSTTTARCVLMRLRALHPPVRVVQTLLLW